MRNTTCHSDASSDSDDGNRLASSLLMRNVNAMNRVVKTLRNVQTTSNRGWVGIG
jgi:hypothetical protein